jgi:hypothetical protein
MVRGAVGDEAIAMTETALQYVTALHPDRNGVTPDGSRAGAEEQRMQQRCNGVQQRCTLRPTWLAHLPRAQEAGLRPLRILVGRTRLDETQLA